MLQNHEKQEWVLFFTHMKRTAAILPQMNQTRTNVAKNVSRYIVKFNHK